MSSPSPHNHPTNITLTDLPLGILEKIFSYLKYKEVTDLRIVCRDFYALSGNCIREGIVKILKQLWSKMVVLETCMQFNLPLETKIKLNQTYTTLEILKMNIFSMYILSRHYTNEKNNCLPLGNILDNIAFHLCKMNTNECATWHEHCLILQNIIARFNIYNNSYINTNNFPFGIHVMDILDVFTGIDYQISCVYDVQRRICFVNAYYYTDNIKFLSYLPDISFIKDCKDRNITSNEAESILKYLLLLVNLYNGLHCKTEEYNREMKFTSLARNSNEYCRKIKSLTFFRKPTIRKFYKFGRIMETYERSEFDKPKKSLLSCEMLLKCSLDEAPYHIMKSYDLLTKDLVLDEKSYFLKTVSSECDNLETVYGAKIKLKVSMQHKNTEIFDICIKDGNEINNEEMNLTEEEEEKVLLTK